jgi:hypothetical protein
MAMEMSLILGEYTEFVDKNRDTHEAAFFSMSTEVRMNKMETPVGRIPTSRLGLQNDSELDILAPTRRAML